jgi:hypothetical protein
MDSTMTRLPAISSADLPDEKRDVAKTWGLILLGSTVLMWALTVAIATGFIAVHS